MKQIRVLGIRLTEGSVKEEIKESLKYLGNGALNTIFYVSSRALVEAGETPECKEWLESMDLTVFGEQGVLPEEVNDYKERRREIEEDVFFHEFIKRLARNHSKILLVSDSEQRLDSLRREMTEIRDNLQFVASLNADSTDTSDAAELVNEINDAAPDVIISQLPNLYQMRLVAENQKLINASIWLALLDERDVSKHKKSLFTHLNSRFYQRVLRRKVNQYKNDEPE